MKKTAALAIILVLLVSMFLSFEISHAATTSSVTLSSSGTILTSSSSVSCVISISGSTVTVASGSSTIYSGTDATTAFTDAFSYCNNGGTVTVDSGTYVGTYQAVPNLISGEPTDAWFFMSDCKNENVDFQSGAILTLPNSPSESSTVLCAWYCNNVVFTGMTVNGNAAHETVGQVTDGVLVYDCNNTVVTHSTIYNCRNYGWSDGSNYNDVASPSGITYCTLYDCYWNGICFDNTRDKGDFAIGNTVYNCSDVGISTWTCNGVLIEGNYIYGINGTDGWAGQGTGSHYGMALEEASVNCVVENNIIKDCPCLGINLGGDGTGNQNELCMNNSITLTPVSGYEIAISEDDNGHSTITENTINGWGQDGAQYGGGLVIYNGTSDIVSFNKLTNTLNPSSSDAICADATNSMFYSNTISQPTTGMSGIEIYTGSSNDAVEYNTIKSDVGITVDSGISGTRIGYNTLTSCVTQISGSYTSLPTTNAILFINCPSIHGTVSPAPGYYSESTSAQVTITLTPETGYTPILNVDGSNVTLSSNSYTLSMTKDQSIYALFATQS